MNIQQVRSMDVDISSNNNQVNKTEPVKEKEKILTDKEDDYKTQFIQSLYDSQLSNFLCDAVIKLQDGGVFSIHRVILSTCSSYFRTLFTTTLHSQRRTEFGLPGIDSEIMTCLLDYAYLRTVKVTQDNVCKLLFAAEYLNISGIMELCCNYVKDILTPENCISIMKFAKEYFFMDLETNVYNYVIRNFPEVSVQNIDILTLSFEELKSIIGAYNLNVKSEEMVWELIVKWIDHDPDARKVYIVDLMRNVRLGLLEIQYFFEQVRNHPYVNGNELCRPIIIETLKFLYDFEMITLKDGEIATPEIARPRIPHDILFTIGGWYGGSATNFMESYDIRADRWNKVPEVDPGPLRSYHGTTVIGFEIYVLGGFNGVEFFNSCRKFNAVTKQWTEVAPMHCRRAYMSVVVLNDTIFAMGGANGQSYRQRSVEKFDYKRNQWTLIAKMNCRRSDAGASILQNKIYIAGGFNGFTPLNSVEVYDPDTNQWTLIRNMRSFRGGCSCVAYQDQIYVIGGFNGIQRLYTSEKYNPVTRAWSSIRNMFTERSNFAVAVIDDMIFVMGGYNGTTTISFVECYCGKTNKWYEATDMNLDRSGVTACIIMGLPNVSDYIHKHRECLMEDKRQSLLALRRQQIEVQSILRQQRMYLYLQQ